MLSISAEAAPLPIQAGSTATEFDHDERGEEGAGEGEAVEKAELDDHDVDRQDDSDRRPERRARRRAQHGRVGQWVADEALQRGTRYA